MNIVIPMAGLGARFSKEGFNKPKPLISVGSKTLVQNSVESLGIYGNIVFITRDFGSEYNKELSDHLEKIAPGCVEIKLEEVTRGATETCLKASHLINNSEELIITNCDQILDWSPTSYLRASREADLDGSILTYHSDSSKNSFALVDENMMVSKIVEKEVVSNIALVGLHYWKKGSDFVKSATELISKFEKEGRPECYISETYNFLISQGKKVAAIDIEPGAYTSLGTPYDLSIYLGKQSEFKTPKPATIFCDIDGTLLKHVHKFSELKQENQKALKGVISKINQWDSIGHKIILCTARKESARKMTEQHLSSLGFCWDHLIMGLTSGKRYLINDKLSHSDEDRAVSISVVTDEGFEDIDWESVGL